MLMIELFGQSKTPPCAVADQNPYGFPARCDCLPPGQGFSFQVGFYQSNYFIINEADL